jgi:hypothetical protein
MADSVFNLGEGVSVNVTFASKEIKKAGGEYG